MPHSDSRPLVTGYHSGAGYSPDGVEPISPVSSPSLTHDKGLSKPLEELEKSHLEGELRHKQPGATRESVRWGNWGAAPSCPQPLTALLRPQAP